MEERVDYEVFKGLQRPLEFLGLQGRYIVWAAITVAVALLGFVIVYIALGFLPGVIFCTSALAYGGGKTFLCMRKGLHTKNEESGIFILSRTRNFL